MKQHHWLGYALAVGAGAGILSAVGVPLSTLVIVLAVLACPLMMLMMLMHGGQPGHGQPDGSQQHHDQERLP